MQWKAIRMMSTLFALSGCMLAASLAQTSEKPLSTLPRQFSATAFGQAGSAAGKSFGLTIFIDGWTTDEQVKDFITVLKEKGPSGLVSAMDKVEDVGRLSPTGRVGNSFRFARYRALPNGGLRIVMATDRPMSFPELYNSGRSTDYPFSIVTMDIDKEGKGSGQLAPLCKVKFNKKGELEIENFGQKPFRLANVYLQK